MLLTKVTVKMAKDTYCSMQCQCKQVIRYQIAVSRQRQYDVKMKSPSHIQVTNHVPPLPLKRALFFRRLPFFITRKDDRKSLEAFLSQNDVNYR